MQPRKLEIVIPAEVAAYIHMDDDEIKARLYWLFLADLVRQGVISFGKAAELAGISKIDFIAKIGQMGIPYLDGDISEVLGDAATVSQAMA